jgi:hypothetical protein
MRLSETDSTVRIGKHLSDMIPINNGLKTEDDLTLLLSNFAVQLAIRTVQVNKYGVKLNCAYWLVVCSDVNMKGQCHKRNE